ncbi:MAG: glycosyltransferase family 9 protein [Cytophagaceae bacterium]
MRIIISRTDNIGDVILTLPLAGYLKKTFPDSTIAFLGKEYTKSIISNCSNIDLFLNKSDVISNPEILKEFKADTIVFAFPDKEVAKASKKAGIKNRIATSHRIFNWLYCNKLVGFSRKKSDLHEAQLNFKLLKGMNINHIPTLIEIKDYYGFPKAGQRSTGKFKLVIHPKSKGSAREWPLSYYNQLIASLNPEEFEIYITGTSEEGKLIKEKFPEIFSSGSVDMTGKFSLEELINFIMKCDGLLACSTGPLHIASALGKYALGLYVPLRPLHPGRWAPIGEKSSAKTGTNNCNGCNPSDCNCIKSIQVHEVAEIIKGWNIRD